MCAASPESPPAGRGLRLMDPSRALQRQLPQRVLRCPVHTAGSPPYPAWLPALGPRTSALPSSLPLLPPLPRCCSVIRSSRDLRCDERWHGGRVGAGCSISCWPLPTLGQASALTGQETEVQGFPTCPETQQKPRGHKRRHSAPKAAQGPRATRVTTPGATAWFPHSSCSLHMSGFLGGNAPSYQSS